MVEEKVVKTMKVLYWVFLLMIYLSIPVKGPLGWWMIPIGAVFALGSIIVMMIFQRKIEKKNREQFKETLETLNRIKF
jgi:uncharacterized ion transporter superfamily protein YfcC